MRSIDHVEFSVVKQSEQKVRPTYKALRTAAVTDFLQSLTLPSQKSSLSLSNRDRIPVILAFVSHFENNLHVAVDF